MWGAVPSGRLFFSKQSKSVIHVTDALASRRYIGYMSSTKLTHRRHTSTHPRDTGHVVLFAESGNEHYGEYEWTLETELRGVPDIVAEYAAEFFGIGIEQAREIVNPDGIVSSAMAWDDHEFVSALWQAMEFGEVPEAAGYRTRDGAVVLDAYSVKMTLATD